MDALDSALDVRMAIPFDPSSNVAGTAMYFSRWLPQAEEQSITVKESDISIKFWFDRSCTNPAANTLGKVQLDLLPDVTAYRVMGNLTVTGLPHQLVQYIIDAATLASARQQPPDDTCPLAEECRPPRLPSAELHSSTLQSARVVCV